MEILLNRKNIGTALNLLNTFFRKDTIEVYEHTQINWISQYPAQFKTTTTRTHSAELHVQAKSNPPYTSEIGCPLIMLSSKYQEFHSMLYLGHKLIYKGNELRLIFFYRLANNRPMKEERVFKHQVHTEEEIQTSLKNILNMIIFSEFSMRGDLFGFEYAGEYHSQFSETKYDLENDVIVYADNDLKENQLGHFDDFKVFLIRDFEHFKRHGWNVKEKSYKYEVRTNDDKLLFESSSVISTANYLVNIQNHRMKITG